MKASIYIAQSLDGFIAGEHDDISWLDEFNDGTDYGYNSFIKKVSAQVMGRVTYEKVQDNPGTPAFSGIKTYVVTSEKNIKPVADNVVIWGKGIPALIRELKKIRKGIVWPVGGAEIMGEFIERGLVSEYIIFTMPVMLGGGKRLFGRIKPKKLELISLRSFANGIIESRYK